MADGTVRGTFDLNSSPARSEMRSMRRDAQLTDQSFERLGRTMDKVGRQTRNIREYRREVRGLGREVQATATRVGRGWDVMERKVLRSTAAQVAAVRELRHEVRALGRERATPSVDLDGIAKAIAQVEILERKLRALDRRRANPRVGGVAGLGGGGLAGGGGGGGRGGVLRSLSLGPLNISPRGLGGLTALGLPAVRALTGAVVALAGSLGSAALGFGALGTAAAGAAATGLGSIAAIAVPATARIKEVYQAQTQFTQAQQASATVANAHRTAVEQDRSAHEALTQAQRQARYAQEALTQARRDARRELVDLSLAADRSRLSERRAAIELRRARSEARRVEFDPTATARERQEAVLDVQEARLGVRESRVQRRRSVTDEARAQRKGVDQMPQVVQARRSLAESRRAAADARRQVRQAADEMSQGATGIANAKAKLDEAFARAPQGTRQLITDIRELRRLWGANDPGTAPGGTDPRVRRAQSTFVGFLGDQVGTLKRMTPTLGAAGLRSTRVLRREGQGFDRFLEGDRTKAFIRTSSAMFDENARQWRLTTQHVTETLMNITRASRPFLREASDFMEDWTGGWAESSRDQDEMRRRIGRMVDQLRSWVRLARAGGRLTRDLLGAGAPEGQTAVDALTQQLNTWDRWVQRNPRQVRDFFRRTVNSTVEMARALARVAKLLSRIGELLTPLLDRFSELVSLVAGLGVPGAPGVIGALVGGWRGGRGRARGGTPAASASMPAAAGGYAPFAAGGAAVGGARGAGFRGRLANSRLMYGIGRESNLSRLGAARAGLGEFFAGGGGVAGGALRGAARGALPLTLGLGALDFASFDGGLGARSLAAANTLSFGLIDRPQTRAQQKEAAQSSVSPDVQAVLRGRGPLGRFTALPGGNSPIEREQRLQTFLRREIRTAPGHDEIVTPAGRTLKGDTAVKEYVNLLKDELDARKGNVRAMRREGAARRDEASRRRAYRVGGDIGKAFNIRSRNVGPEQAMEASVGEALKTLRGMRPAGAKILGENTLAWAREQARANPALLGQVHRLEREIKRSFSRTGQHVAIVNGRILTGSRKEWDDISTAISSRAEEARQEASDSFTALQRQAVGSLTSMGFNRGQARRIVQDMEHGGKRGRQAKHYTQNAAQARGPGPRTPQGLNAPGRYRALGGKAYRLPGRGLHDTVQMADGGLGAPGEMVIARHTEQRLNRKLLNSREPTTVGREVGRETREHSKPFRAEPRAPGGRRRRPYTDTYSLGGSLFGRAAAGAVDLMGASPSLAPYALIGRRFGLRVSSGARPGSITSSGNVSLHSSGDALDLSNGTATPGELRYARYMAQHYGRGLDELIHTPLGFGIKNGQRVPPYATADHYDHVHVGDRTPSGGARGLAGGVGGGGLAGRIRLRPLRSRLGGVPGALSTRAGEIHAAGLERRLNRWLGRQAGAGMGDLAGFTGGGSAAANMRLGRRMMLAAGWGPQEWAALRALWMGESGWSSSVVNSSSGATGIPQALPGSKMASAGRDWRTNPATQIRWGLGYIRGRYGSPSGAYHAWLSRSPHWYATGGRLGGQRGAGGLVVGQGGLGAGGLAGGRLAYVGDSLGVGTAPYLRGRVGGMMSNTRVGRSSASGLDALRAMHGYGRVLFDLGTNDPSAGALGRSLRAADRVTGNAPLYVPTVHGPAAAAKNALLRRMAGGDIHLLRTGSRGLGPDGIHYNAAGYRARAARFAGAFRDGGGFLTNGPAHFMAGEGQPSGGRERVRVERLRGIAAHLGGRRRSAQLVVQGPLISLEGVTVKGQHDLNELVGKAAEHAAKKLIAALDGVPDTPDEDLVR